ncbi:TPA: tyrosine-type recombinase/integrase [Listeria innocua]|uniref:tyrosine-type recombinase/integrase n=1 Tax=Bacilli TaxID=91061 RepID=UPI00045B6D25|nr:MULTISPECIES: tyrosine-type recombinase/integrase [Bacilli]EAD5764649.1 site-specific integrase [Listeria innocua]EAE2436802.1 site-specific integrase [Listeria innocua]EAG8532998.1 site-specific integrase [Listeria innocua]ECC1773064.1 tyrosine-type recombinase/integrase [Listeria innocua]ECJ9437266.1 tyrosine-type recombinase/integrase [Listeria innocua]
MAKRQTTNVQPIKDSNVLKQVQDTLLDSFKAGRRNYTIFQLGKATLLRVSDVLSLEYSDVFTVDGVLKERAYIRDQKTGKPNTLYLKPIEKDLYLYKEWLDDNGIKSQWLFPSSSDWNSPVTRKQYYKIMQKTGDLLGINYLGTHTMRKTGAYRVYEQTNYNIGFVMKLLNHSDQKSTLSYLGLDEVQKEELLDTINFG